MSPRAPLAAAGAGEATAKFILIGEHAVVYGHPAIALPVPTLAMRATVEPAPGPLALRSEHYSGPVAEAPAALAPVRAALIATIEHLDLADDGILVATESAIPIERGLGSSAAVSAAVVRALFDAVGRTPTPSELFELVQVSERVAHGTPSGLDAHATTSPTPIRFEAGVATPLPLGIDATFVIADTGIRGQTRAAVAGLRARRDEHPDLVEPRLARIHELTELAAADIAAGDVLSLGRRMSGAHVELRELGVSSAELDRLVDAAGAAGALGAKLTGGGRGGCMVAVADTRDAAGRLSEALLAAGAASTWVTATAATA